MNAMTKQELLWAAASVLLILCLFVVGHKPAPSAPLSIPELREGIDVSIHTLGPERAYSAFKKEYQGEDANTLHTYAHLFGEELYAIGGLSGVAACDSDFSFGCFHGFFTKAVAAEGLDVVPRLDDACRDTSAERHLPCQHGIGHGILEYVGHASAIPALEACRRIPNLDPIGGCASGVFMEYNVPAVLTEDGMFEVEPRPLDSAAPYDLCPSLSQDFQRSCFHELPQWWEEVYGMDFERLGQLCSVIPDEENRYACVSGLGSVIAITTVFDVSKTAAACDALSDSVAACRVSAAWAVHNNNGNQEGARVLCEPLTFEEKQLCPQ